MIFDSNENGKVSVDETMAFLHARYGREGLEFKLKELFGRNMVEVRKTFVPVSCHLATEHSFP